MLSRNDAKLIFRMIQLVVAEVVTKVVTTFLALAAGVCARVYADYDMREG